MSVGLRNFFKRKFLGMATRRLCRPGELVQKNRRLRSPLLTISYATILLGHGLRV